MKAECSQILRPGVKRCLNHIPAPRGQILKHNVIVTMLTIAHFVKLLIRPMQCNMQSIENYGTASQVT